jgi:hypothetical protein
MLRSQGYAEDNHMRTLKQCAIDGAWGLEPCQAADRNASHRWFLAAGGVRRLYVFKNDREIRDIKVKHLDRQVEHAKPMPTKAAAKHNDTTHLDKSRNREDS